MKQTIYTTAPENYDYGYCESEVTPYVFIRSDKQEFPIRKVEIPDESVDYQVGRYLSGLHMAVGEKSLQTELDYGYVKVKA